MHRHVDKLSRECLGNASAEIINYAEKFRKRNIPNKKRSELEINVVDKLGMCLQKKSILALEQH